jgi:hypothetical protein
MRYLQTYQIFENSGSGNASFDWLIKQNNERYLELLDLLQSEIFDDYNIVSKTTETFEMGSDEEGYPYHKFWTFRTKSQKNSDEDTSNFNSIKDKEIDCIIVFNIEFEETGDFLSKLEDCKFRFESHTGKKISIQEEPCGGPENPGVYDYIIKIK